MMSVRATITSLFEQVAREQQRKLSPLSDDLRLLESGLDSLSFALRIQGGSAVKRLGDRCHVHIVDSADHTFTHSRARAVLEQILSDELFVRHDQPVDASGARQVARDSGNDEVSAGDAK